jgi:hypothetical protein
VLFLHHIYHGIFGNNLPPDPITGAPHLTLNTKPSYKLVINVENGVSK